MECLLSAQFTAHKVCVCVWGGVRATGRHSRFESTLRMCYNDILSATTAAGICRTSLSTNTEPETRTETDKEGDKAFIGVELEKYGTCRVKMDNTESK